MSLVLTLRIRLGNDSMQTSSDIANALEDVAQRFRESGYVETVQDNPGEEITRGVRDGNGQTVGEFTLMEMP